MNFKFLLTTVLFLFVVGPVNAQKVREFHAPQPRTGFFYKGIRYKSYNDFRGTEDWKQMRAEAWARQARDEAEKEAAKRRRQRAVSFKRYRSRYNSSTLYFMDRHYANQQYAHDIMGDWWWKKYIEHPELHNEHYKKVLDNPHLLRVPYKNYEVKSLKR